MDLTGLFVALNTLVSLGVLLFVARAAFLAGRLVQRLETLEKVVERLALNQTKGV